MFRGDEWRCMAVALAIVVSPVSAGATDLPPNARDLLREAYPKERPIVVNVLKRLFPASTDEIDKLIVEIDQKNKAKVEGMGLIEGLRGEVALGGFYSTGNTKEWGVTG